MTTFVMVGKYSSEALGSISAARTEAARKLIESNGGKLVSAYATLGATDVLLIVELPSVEAAVKTSVALSKQLGIAFSTSPAVPADVFDSLVGN